MYIIKSILTPEMTDLEILRIMSSGKPAALLFLKRLIEHDQFEGMYSLMVFDRVGIYGSNIFRLYTNYCHENPTDFFNLISKMSTCTEKIVDVKKFLGLIK